MRWPQSAVSLMPRQVPSSITTGRRSGRAWRTALGSGIPMLKSPPMRHYAAVDIRFPYAAGLRPGDVYVDDVPFPYAEVTRSEIFNDFYRPTRLGRTVAAMLFNARDRLSLIIVHRALGRAEFSDVETKRMQLLTSAHHPCPASEPATGVGQRDWSGTRARARSFSDAGPAVGCHADRGSHECRRRVSARQARLPVADPARQADHEGFPGRDGPRPGHSRRLCTSGGGTSAWAYPPLRQDGR